MTETALRELLTVFRYKSSTGRGIRGLDQHHIDALTDHLMPHIQREPLGDPKELKLFCIVCRAPIPLMRALRGSNTCEENCRKHRDAMKRAQVDKKECRHCAKPSTPEERRLFQRWRKSQPDYKPAKRGRPNKGSKHVTDKVQP